MKASVSWIVESLTLEEMTHLFIQGPLWKTKGTNNDFYKCISKIVHVIAHFFFLHHHLFILKDLHKIIIVAKVYTILCPGIALHDYIVHIASYKSIDFIYVLLTLLLNFRITSFLPEILMKLSEI